MPLALHFGVTAETYFALFLRGVHQAGAFHRTVHLVACFANHLSRRSEPWPLTRRNRRKAAFFNLLEQGMGKSDISRFTYRVLIFMTFKAKIRFARCEEPGSMVGTVYHMAFEAKFPLAALPQSYVRPLLLPFPGGFGPVRLVASCA
jgi:hypothetical protein